MSVAELLGGAVREKVPVYWSRCGVVRATQAHMFDGKLIDKPCRECSGRGRVRRTKTLSVKVPPGVDNGDRIRLAREGEPGRNGGPPGDLYVDISVKAHPIFTREGQNLSCEVPVSFATAVLGGTVDVPTLDVNTNHKLTGMQAGVRRARHRLEQWMDGGVEVES